MLSWMYAIFYSIIPKQNLIIKYDIFCHWRSLRCLEFWGPTKEIIQTLETSRLFPYR